MSDYTDARTMTEALKLKDRYCCVQAERDKWYVCGRDNRRGFWSAEKGHGLQTTVQEYLTSVGIDADQPRVERIIRAMRGLLRAYPEQFDADPNLLGVMNGVVDLRTGRLREIRPEDMLTKQVPLVYDPTAECPDWEQQIRVMFRSGVELDSPADPELPGLLQLAAGAAISGRAPHLLVILHGPPQNGKGTFTRVASQVLGQDYAAELGERALFGAENSHPTELMKFRGRRMVVSSDVSAVGRLNLGRLKRLTGGDVISARHMRQDEVDFKPTHVLFITCNRLPDVGRDSFAPIRERVRPFRCGPTIPEDLRDGDLEDRLVEQEGPGILRWFVKGAVQWHQNGQHLPLTDAQRDRVDEWEARDDPIREWFDSCCDLGEHYSCSQDEWLQSLRFWWAENRTERSLPPTPEMQEWLTEAGHPSVKKRWPDGRQARRRIGFRVRAGVSLPNS